jgi:hypothetical protein
VIPVHTQELILHFSPHALPSPIQHATNSSLFYGTFKISKYFSLTPEEAPEPPPLKKGKIYLIKGRNTARSYALFLNRVTDKENGLIITRKSPPQMKSFYNIEAIPLLWLCQKEEKDVLFPTHLHKLVYLISETVSTHDNSIILLDGLEYLVVHNRFDTVIKQLYIIRDVLWRHGGILLIPLDPEAFSEREMGLLEKESVSI